MSLTLSGRRCYLAVGRVSIISKLGALRLGQLVSCVLVNEGAEIVPLLALPLAGASLHFAELHLAETLMIAIVPLEDILDTGCLLLKFRLLSAEMRLELGKILLDKIELDNLLRLCNARVVQGSHPLL
jgi:hypothetical protein